jgi:hypothetical protein
MLSRCQESFRLAADPCLSIKYRLVIMSGFAAGRRHCGADRNTIWPPIAAAQGVYAFDQKYIFWRVKNQDERRSLVHKSGAQRIGFEKRQFNCSWFAIREKGTANQRREFFEKHWAIGRCRSSHPHCLQLWHRTQQAAI